ncbi:MAG: SPOR domain-containing protein [Erythrobacter sp.]|uniref:SPOR domain-containing protein n=1 Tax=Erythrobacter sp. TaxID=1042 RepID=UPI003266D81D
MIIDAEFEEVEGSEGELDLSDDDSLPWLEADEDDGGAGGVDNTQIIILALILLGILALAVGTVWIFGNQTTDDTQVADGSVIEAPKGPYKERPDDPGGKEFAGTGNVAPVVGEGGTPEGVMNTSGNGGDADPAGAATGTDQNGATSGSANAIAAGANGSGQSGAQPNAATSRSGVGVQLAAYSSRARAEQGWNELSRRTDALSGLRYRIEKGVVDIGTVYRLQAVASDRAAANQLCANLKSDGIDCQVKG